jgi:hypothetical protein
MIKWVGVMPWMFRPFYEACAATMHPDFKKNVLFVDNSETNLGIMKSHNMGIEKMQQEGADWLIILSAAIRFGEPGGLDFIQAIEDHGPAHVLHGFGPKPDDLGRKVPYGWHLVAFHRTTLEAIGGWDENFTPYSLDDVDMGIRIRTHFKDQTAWESVPCDVSDTISAHSIKLGGMKGTYPPRGNYFKRKWGREGGEWDKASFATPFNDPALPLNYWPLPTDPLSIWENEYKTGEFGKFDDVNL